MSLTAVVSMGRQQQQHPHWNNQGGLRQYHTTTAIRVILYIVVVLGTVESFVVVVTDHAVRHPSSLAHYIVLQQEPWRNPNMNQGVGFSAIAASTDCGDETSTTITGSSVVASTTSPPSPSLPIATPIHQKNVGLYIHIPYCRKRCYYCNFAIVPVGDQTRPHQNTFTASSSHPIATTSSDQTQKHLPVITRNDGFHVMNDQYVRAVFKELQLIALQQPPSQQPTLHRTGNTIVLQSVYFGGGTPSLLPMTSLREILHAIQHVDSPFTLTNDCEISMEIDPGTFTHSMVQEWNALGINRFSLGVQSMDDTLLRHLGRTHTVSDIYHSIQLLQSVYASGGGDDDRKGSHNECHLNYSIDLISGIPGLTIPKWMDTLEMVTTTLHPPPKHFSIYDLQLEPNTVFGRRYETQTDDDDDDSERSSSYLPGASATSPTSNVPLPSLQDAAFMYKYASGYLRSKSYEHYEISSYAYIPKRQQQQGRQQQSSPLPLENTSVSYRSRHNQIYWGYHNVSAWYAMGLGATSFDLHEEIVKRPNAMSDYIQWVDDTYTQLALSKSTKKEELHLNDKNYTDANLHHSTDDNIVEEIMDIVLKRLRTKDGLSLQYIREQYGSMYVNIILRGLQDVVDNDPQHNLIAITRTTSVNDCDDDRIVRLVDPMGFLYSNTIISNIFYELIKEQPSTQRKG
jgi:coproporphyrinogen III oxidase-like Fe-S oxidoreductase